MKKVVVALNLIGSSGRRQLSGILSFLDGGHRNWSIRLVSDANGLMNEIAAAESGGEIDGFIIGLSLSQDLCARLSKLTQPLAAIGIDAKPFAARRGVTLTLNIDNGGIGMTAACYLHGLGNFRSFAFIGAERFTKWSERRGKAFVSELSRRGVTAEVFDGRSLGDFLQKLKKPAAVFASHDCRALDVLAAASAARLKVPDQLVVLGVDDDETFCLAARPSLSSVRTDTEAAGFHAAEAMNKLLNGRKPRHLTFLAKTRGIVERDSTHPPAPAADLVKRALAFVHAEAVNGISPDDVARHLRISRRLLDLRFHELENRTVGEAILKRKLAVFQRLLRETKIPVSKLAARCGFTNVNSLHNLFRRRYGRSIGDFRKSLRVTGSRSVGD